MAEKSLEERQAEMRSRMGADVRERSAEKIIKVVDNTVPGLTEQMPDEPEPATADFGITKDRCGFTITRSQLYDLVWKEPMVKAAQRFQVSDVAVAKACRKYKIPVPWRGYWARLAAGQTLRRTRLSPGQEKGTQITFTPLPKPEPVTEVQATQTLLLEDESKHLHPVVRKTKLAFQKKSLDQQGRYWPATEFLDVRVTSGQVDRAMRILSTLLKAAEARGHQIILGKPSSSDREARWARLSVDSIPIVFNVKERVRQVVHPPTPEEQILIEKGRDYMVPRHDFIPTGELTLSITEPYAGGIQTAWQDGKRRHIEEFLGNILETFTVVAQMEQERRKQRAIQAQLDAERAKLRYEEQQRIRRLEEQIKEWRRSAEFHAYAGAVEAAIIKNIGKFDSESELGQWVGWIRRYADYIDPSQRDDIGRERRYW